MKRRDKKRGEMYRWRRENREDIEVEIRRGRDAQVEIRKEERHTGGDKEWGWRKKNGLRGGKGEEEMRRWR